MPSHEILQTLGHRVRVQRLAQGLPQRGLAQMAGLSLGLVDELEAMSSAFLPGEARRCPLRCACSQSFQPKSRSSPVTAALLSAPRRRVLALANTCR